MLTTTTTEGFGPRVVARQLMQSTDGDATDVAPGTVKVVGSAVEFMLAAQSEEPTHIVLESHISFPGELGDAGLQGQETPVDIAVTAAVKSIRVRAVYQGP